MNTPKLGDKRIKEGFLFLPMAIYNDDYRDVRWLDFAQWEEVYTECEFCEYWKTIRFID